MDDERARVDAARRQLARWSPHTTAPALVAESVARLNLGMPTFIYAIPNQGKGALANVAFDPRFPIPRVMATRFIRAQRLFAPRFTTVTAEESPWGARNQAILGRADLAADCERWGEFRRDLMDEAEFDDHLRIYFMTADGEWLGLCGSFARRGHQFTERDRRVMEAVRDDLLDVLLAAHALEAPGEQQLSLLERADRSPYPAFAYTSTGKYLLANAAAAREREAPDWLPAALLDRSRTPPEFRVHAAPYAGGEALLFMRAPDPGEEPLDRFLLNALKLPPYLQETALLAAKGRTNRQIADDTGLTPGSVNAYVRRILAIAGVSSKTEPVYEVARQALATRSLWPRVMRFDPRAAAP